MRLLLTYLNFCISDAGNSPSAQLHQHAFYQIEFCLSGQLFCKSRTARFALSPGEYWLIPPEQPHQFIDNRAPYEYLLIKFNSILALPEHRGSDPVSVYYLNAILDIIRNAGTISGFPGRETIIENHLSGILHHLATLSSENESESPFIMAIREEVCKRGYAVNVAELADFFRYTRSQLQYRFSKEYNGNTNLKRFMEDILLELAEKHLQYSSMTLTEIAREMNFPSIYVFSRFYKRKTRGFSTQKTQENTLEIQG